MKDFYHQLLERMDLLIDAVNSNPFTWSTFFTALSIAAPIIASFVALHISGSYRRVRIVLTGNRINKHTFEEKHDNGRNCQEITVYNASERKVRLQNYGYMVGRIKISPECPRIIYNFINEDEKNPVARSDWRPLYRTIMDESINHLPFHIHEGDDCKFCLYPGDYVFNNVKKNKRLYVFIKINEKIKKYYTGLTLNKFLSLTEKIKDKTPYYYQ